MNSIDSHRVDILFNRVSQFYFDEETVCFVHGKYIDCEFIGIFLCYTKSCINENGKIYFFGNIYIYK